MSVTVDFIFDFGSPNAYLVHKVLPDIAQRTGATFRYLPCLLGGIFKSTGNQPPWRAYASVPPKLDYERLEIVRFIKAHRLTRFKMNPNFPVNSLMLMRGAIVAQAGGRLADYVDAGFRFMWEDGMKMDDPTVFTQAYSSVGFDGKSLLERMQEPAIKEQLAKNTEEAVARGVFGIPTFFVGDEIFFGKERLGQIEEAIKAAA